MQVLKTIEYVLGQAAFPKKDGDGENADGEPGMGRSSSAASNPFAPQEQPKSFMLKRGDHAANPGVVSNNRTTPVGGHVHQSLGGPSSGQSLGGPSSSGGTLGGALGGGISNAGPSGPTMGTTGSAVSQEEMRRQREARMQRLEKDQAEAKKAQEEANRKAKARDALGGLTGAHK